MLCFHPWLQVCEGSSDSWGSSSPRPPTPREEAVQTVKCPARMQPGRAGISLFTGLLFHLKVIVKVCLQVSLASQVAQLIKKICLQCRRPQFNSWVGKFPWRRKRLPTPVFLGLPGGSHGKESVCNAGDLGSIPGFGRSPGGGHGNPF